MEVCQPGIDDVLPSWCVQYDLGMETGIQLMIELAILGVLFLVSYLFFSWRRKKKNDKEMHKKILEKENSKWDSVKYKGLE